MVKRRRKQKVQVDPSRLLTVVGDGMVARMDSFGGAAVPVLVLDSAEVPEIAEAIRASEFEPEGDVSTRWAQSGECVLLEIQLIRPVPVHFYIIFDLTRQGILVELALQSRLILIKAGDRDSSFKSTFGDRGIHVQVQGLDNLPTWPSLFIKVIMGRLRREGLSLLDARKAAAEVHQMNKKVASIRMNNVIKTSGTNLTVE